MCVEYLKFLYRSTNEHGVHSPFVFSLLTKGIYNKDKKWRQYSKKQNFIPRVMDYFQPKSIWLCNQQEKKLPSFIEVVNNLSEISKKVDLIWLEDNCNGKMFRLQNLISVMHNDSVLLVNKSKKTKELESLWQKIIRDERFIVTIDFYYYGLAFTRCEQMKQHFILRM